MAKNKKSLKGIKSGAFSRGFALARVSMTAGARVASHAVGNLFVSEAQKPERFKEMLKSQMDLLARELGQLKGSLMKVGQLLSMYGEHFLPEDVNAILKSLQNQSPPLEWAAIEKVVLKQLSAEQRALVEIDPEPLASASLGQVHKAKRKSDGQWLAMKIQYPGVDRAIESDLNSLRSLLSISKLIPMGPQYDALFKEVRTMLHQEVDYEREFVLTQDFSLKLSDDPSYVIPKIIPELSTKRILTSTLEEGVAVDSPEVKGLSQKRRNALGLLFLKLYLREILEFGSVQTDPHFGNYRVRLGKEGEPDRMVLLDFGAVRKFSKSFLDSYRKIVRGGYFRDAAQIIEGATGLGFLKQEDSEESKKIFTDLCFMITEPFYTPETPGVPRELYDAEGAYLWGESDLPKRVARKGADLAFVFKLRAPPREIVFLDRKLGGVFIFLSMLKVRLKLRDAIAPFFGIPLSPSSNDGNDVMSRSSSIDFPLKPD